jgi:hypothetical protein
MYLQVCGGEKYRNTHAGSLASPGQARRGVQAHDVHVNSSVKSDPKPHRSVTSFFHLFLLRVHI